MQLDEVSRQGESESGATKLAGAGLVHPIEPLEEVLQMLRRDPGSGVVDRHLDLSVHRPHPGINRRTSVLDRVVEEVQEHLFEEVLVTRDLAGPCWALDLESR